MSKVFVATLVIGAFILGFISGRIPVGRQLQPNQPTPMPQTQESEALKNSSSLFKSQTATIQGKITKVLGNIAQVESDTGAKGEFEISDKVLIYKFKGGSGTASASSDLKEIQENMQVLITLALIEGKYKIVSISYFRQAP